MSCVGLFIKQVIMLYRVIMPSLSLGVFFHLKSELKIDANLSFNATFVGVFFFFYF